MRLVYYVYKMSIVEEADLPVLMRLYYLLRLYEGIRKNEKELIQIITKEIELIKSINENQKIPNPLVEQFIGEYNYPRNLDEEEDDEYFDIDNFTISELSDYDKFLYGINKCRKG